MNKSKAFRLADNKTLNLLNWDFSKLEDELAINEKWICQFIWFEGFRREVPDNATDDDFDPDEILKHHMLKKVIYLYLETIGYVW